MSKIVDYALGAVAVVLIILLGLMISIPLVQGILTPLLPTIAEGGSAVGGMITTVSTLLSSLPLPTIIAIFGIILGLLLVLKGKGVGSLLMIIGLLSLFVGANNVAALGDYVGKLINPYDHSVNSTSTTTPRIERPVMIEARSPGGQIIAWPHPHDYTWLSYPGDKCIQWGTDHPEEDDVYTDFIDKNGDRRTGNSAGYEVAARGWKSKLPNGSAVRVNYTLIARIPSKPCPEL